MAPIAHIGTKAYDMGDAVQAAQYHKDINELLQDQHNLIQTLQAAPGLNQQNFTQLLNALTPAARRTTGVTNPILSNYNGAGNVDYEEEIPEPGIEDIAKFPIPEPFTGKTRTRSPSSIAFNPTSRPNPKPFVSQELGSCWRSVFLDTRKRRRGPSKSGGLLPTANLLIPSPTTSIHGTTSSKSSCQGTGSTT